MIQTNSGMVEKMREIRNDFNRQTADMNYDELRAFLDKELSEGKKRTVDSEEKESVHHVSR